MVKNYNEDRVSIIMNITKPNFKGKWPKCSYFGIFDGHGGHICSDFLKDNMHKFVCFIDYVDYIKFVFPASTNLSIENGI
jgi:serine/threonine protein phosphatase PrpC